MPLGRRDGTTANITAANNLPSPFDNLTTLQQKFGAVGLDDTDLVALSGKRKGGEKTGDACLVILTPAQHEHGVTTTADALQGRTRSGACSASS